MMMCENPYPPRSSYSYSVAGIQPLVLHFLHFAPRLWTPAAKNAMLRSLGILMTRVFALCFLLLVPVVDYGGDWSMFRGNPQLTGVATDELPADLQPLWTYPIEGGTESTAAIWSGIVFIGSTNGSLLALDLGTGALKWKYQATDEIKSSPSVHSDTVYFGDEKGTFHALDARTGEKRWTFQAD